MLEEVIRENTLAVRELIAAISAGNITAARAVVEKAAPAAAPAAATAAAPAPAPAAPKSVTFDDVRGPFVQLSASPGGPEKCKAVLSQFGVPKLSAAQPSQFAGILAAVQEALS